MDLLVVARYYLRKHVCLCTWKVSVAICWFGGAVRESTVNTPSLEREDSIYIARILPSFLCFNTYYPGHRACE